ncbi:MAG: Glu-tRNA(Gln) amidotransferase subunit GatE [Promethearchaeota archaeon]
MIIDYKKIGLKCGIEIHQQLATEKKLFCNCSAKMQDKKPVFEIRRKLRPVAGELGDIDRAAAYEALKNKTFRYKVYLNESCEVELDEEPPHPINREALEISLQIAKMLNCEIPDEIHVMRKTVLDGSNTTGFQRTAIIGLNGWVETEFGKIRITNVCLEEDACQILEKSDNFVVYGLNRLGIPLVEISTSSDISNPEHAKIVAEKIGLILRSTKVRRGIGTIRQDLNVSIKNGARVEIKGVQELKLIPKLIDNEVKRQLELIKQNKQVGEEVRKAMPDGSTVFLRPLPGSARMYPETDVPPIYTKNIIKKIKLPESLDEKKKKLEKILPKELAQQILTSEYYDIFKDMSSGFDPVLVASTLLNTMKYLKREGLNIKKVTKQHLHMIFSLVHKKKIPKNKIEDALRMVITGSSFDEIERKLSVLPKSELKKIVEDVLRTHKGLSEKAIMGIIMSRVKGRASGSDVIELLRSLMKKLK